MRGLTGLCIALCSLAIVLFTGCSGDGPPSGVLPRDKMQQVLWDMIEADQYSLLYLAKDSARINVKAETAGRYEQVFELHKISKNEFDKSVKYYFSRPDIAKPLLDSLAAMGIRKRTEDYNHNRPATTSVHTPAAAPATPPGGPTNTVPGKSNPAKAPIIPGHPPVPPSNSIPGHPQLPASHLSGHVPGSTPQTGASKTGTRKAGTLKTDSSKTRTPKSSKSKAPTPKPGPPGPVNKTSGI